MGVLLPTELWIGFTVVSVVLTIGLVQTVLTYRGGSLLPGLGGKRPEHVDRRPPSATALVPTDTPNEKWT